MNSVSAPTGSSFSGVSCSAVSFDDDFSSSANMASRIASVFSLGADGSVSSDLRFSISFSA